MRNLISIVFLLSFQHLVTANHVLAASLYQQIAQTTNGNFLLSVFPLEVTLSLLLEGSNGTTATQIESVLARANTSHATKAAVQTILGGFLANRNITYDMASGLDLRSGLSITSSIQSDAADLNSTVQNIDFSQGGAVQTINSWAEKYTANQIHNLVNSDDVYSGLTMIALDALFFQSNWAATFLTESVVPGWWYYSRDNRTMVDMMYQHGYKRQFASDSTLNATILELPLGSLNSGFYAVFVLPNLKDGLPLVEKNLVEAFGPHNTTEQIVHVQLPKFHFETKLELQEALENLGITAAFNKTEANFSGVAGNPGDVFLNRFVQKTTIQVNEYGINTNSGPSAQDIPTPSGTVYPFIADHPLIFYVYNEETIIFVGRIVTPNSAGASSKQKRKSHRSRRTNFIKHSHARNHHQA